jgi:hypothetical protein
MTTAALIKHRISLREAASMVGFQLPKDGTKFRSPLRPDRNPSCTVQGETMRDWSRGKSFDCIAFFAAAKRISNAEAIKTLGGHLGVTVNQRIKRKASPMRSPQPPLCDVGLTLDGREPTDNDFSAILCTRNLPPEAEGGLVLAHNVGVLHFATVLSHASWLVTDQKRTIAEARRLDGNSFPAIGSLGERKAHTLKGSRKSWPVGLDLRVNESRFTAVQRLPLALVEGGPDLLAAFCLLAALPMSQSEVQPVAMLGSEAAIGTDALAMMSRRPCIILAHGDSAGRSAAGRWAGQLTGAGCRVILRELPDGQDLNDAVSAHGLAATIGAIVP